MNIRISLGLMLCAASLIAGCGRTVHEIDAPRATQESPNPVVAPAAPVFYQTPIPDAPTPTPVPSIIPTPTPIAAAPVTSAPPLPSLPKQTVTADRNLFVVISGNGTCNPKRNSDAIAGLWSTDLFDYFIRNILNQRMIRPQDDVLFLCYERLSPDMNFFDLRSSREMQPIDETQVDSLVLSRSRGVRQLFIVGYSYGGWRSMKLAASPAIIAATPLPSILVTIDPISKVTCTHAFDSGCHEPPQDFSVQEMQTLNTRTRWINLFETQGLLVSSGSISSAHQNYEIDANHLNVTGRDAVWSTIVPFFTSQLNTAILPADSVATIDHSSH